MMQNRIVFSGAFKVAPVIAAAFLLMVSGSGLAFADRHTNKDTISIIGTGDLGDSTGISLAKRGYKIIYGSRDPSSDKAQNVVARTGNGAVVLTNREAVRQSDIVVIAVGWPAMETVAQSLGDLSGKIVVDVSAPFRQAADGYMEHRLETSSAEAIAGWNPGAVVLKWALPASNRIDIPLTEEDGGKIAVWIAGDDRAAKERLARITYDMELEPFDAGPLRMARQVEAAWSILYMTPFVQRRSQTWDYSIKRSNFFPCYMATFDEPWFDPVYDADNLAVFPGDDRELEPCPAGE